MGYLEILLIAGLILINGFFVTAEFALVKVRATQIDQLAEQGNWAARLTSKALDRLDFYLSASQIGITMASLALGCGDARVGRAEGERGCRSAAYPDARRIVVFGVSIGVGAAGRALAGDLPAHGAGRAGTQDAWRSASPRSWRV